MQWMNLSTCVEVTDIEYIEFIDKVVTSQPSSNRFNSKLRVPIAHFIKMQQLIASKSRGLNWAAVHNEPPSLGPN